MKRAFLFMPYNPGDVVMAMHVAPFLKYHFPGLHLDFVVGEEALGLAQGRPWFSKVFGLPRQALREGLARGQSIQALSGLVAAHLPAEQTEPYDLGINLFQDRMGGFLAAHLDAKTRIGLWATPGAGMRIHAHWMERWMALPVERSALPLHTVDLHRLAVHEAIRESPPQPLPKSPLKWPEISPLLWPAPGPTKSPPSALASPSHAPSAHRAPNAILHPGSAWRGKRWPIENWVALSETLLQAGWSLTVTGSREEMHLQEAWPQACKEQFKSTLNFRLGQTTWPGFVELCHRHSWMLSGDTVAMHLGAAAGCRVLALFGASNPRETGPYGPGHFIWEMQNSADAYPAQLPLGREHSGLASLPARAVSDFLLHGRLAGVGTLWETARHPRLPMQILRKPTGESPDSEKISAWFSQGMPEPREKAAHAPLEALPPALAELQNALLAAIRQASEDNLRRLEQVEGVWAETSQRSLVWEAYRIGINGLPLLPLKTYLQSRQQRFMQALGEWRLHAIPSLSGIASHPPNKAK